MLKKAKKMKDYSPSEMMIVRAARELEDGQVVFVGIGLPNLAANLAKRLHAPHIEMIYEAGVFGAHPLRLPLSIGDPTLVSGATAICSIPEIFMYYLQGGLIDVGMVGAAQIDRYGNINTTVIGDYQSPKVRLPGIGGASAISLLAKKMLVITNLTKRGFPEKVDFISTPGFLGGKRERDKLPVEGKGPSAIITDLGVFGFDRVSGEVVLQSLYPGVTVEEVRERVGWELRISDRLTTSPEPEKEELRIIREELDPRKIYI